MNPTVTLIVNTAQQPEYLKRVLRGVARQTDFPDEVIIAEDGGDAATRAVVQQSGIASYTCLHHVTQEKEGFRRSRILNEAIARAETDYIIFLDGDTIPHPDFVRDHRRLARPGHFIQGHRVLIGEKAALWFGAGEFGRDRRRALFAGQLSGWKHIYRWVVPFKRVLRDLDGVRGCNLSMWRSDLVRVNGYDEDYVGWGCEDLDLTSRLFHNSVWRLDVRGRALCYHLWHPLADRSNLASNLARLDRVIRTRPLRCDSGLDRHSPGSPLNGSAVACRPECEANQQA